MTSYIDYFNWIQPDGRPSGAQALLDNRFSSEAVSQEINFVSNLSGPWHWSSGAFYRNVEDIKYQPLTLLFLGGLVITNDDFTDKSEAFAVYGDIGRRFADDTLDLSVGLRYFQDRQAMHINQAYGAAALVPVGVDFKANSHAVTPRAVLTWTPSPGHSFYASYAQGFRSGFAQQPRVQNSFPDFDPVEPDKLSNYEMGAKGSMFDRKLVYEAAVYYIDWNDIQRSLILIPNPSQPISVTAVVNGVGASGAGVSMNLTSRPVNGLELGASVAWNDLRLDADVVAASGVIGQKGARLAGSSKYTLAGFAGYSWDLGAGYTVEASASASYVPSTFVGIVGPISVFSHSVTTANARLSVHAPENWTLAVFGDNLTNEDDTTSRTAGIPGSPLEWSPRLRPLTFGVQLEYRFGP